MWKPKTGNQTLPCGKTPIEAEKIQYPEWNKNSTGKRLWSVKDN